MFYAFFFCVMCATSRSLCLMRNAYDVKLKFRHCFCLFKIIENVGKPIMRMCNGINILFALSFTIRHSFHTNYLVLFAFQIALSSRTNAKLNTAIVFDYFSDKKFHKIEYNGCIQLSVSPTA